ncbi:MAG: response regulator, partial [Chitinispirillaceae bacterium]|nr:response regulator [Chitinispirillaceae bacterium]
MKENSKKFPRDCTILIVDDDPLICDLLKRSLEDNFKVYICNSGKTALQYIDEYNPDVVVTDLKIPDISGLEVLQYAKRKDEFTEVIVITGHPSLDSATLAINQGVYSYLLKPLQLSEFLVQVEKAVASRLFHLKSLEIMRAPDGLAPDVKKHFEDITILYHFLRKLMLSLEIPEIMRVSLDEINRRTEAILAIINVSFLGYNEMYVMPSVGEITEEMLKSILNRFKDQIPVTLTNGENKKEIVPVIYKGRCGKISAKDYSNLICHPVPMMVTDKVIGNLILFFNSSFIISSDLNQFLYIFSSIVSSAVEHGYITLQARQQAKTDSLTGISNHRHFHEVLDKEISRANRRKSTFSLILIDIDNFLHYYALELYLGNSDWPHNNLKRWRYRGDRTV